MEAPVSVGEVLAGKYRVDRVLGMGGMGVVVAAYDLMLERRVAIKFLLNDALQNPEIVARFAREARSAVRIESEHIARVIDVGVLPVGAPYIVMEYLEGNDLAHRVATQGAVPVEEAVDYLLQACEAVAEAHALGIVHRDLKPANLFLTRRADGTNFVKVLDFGISKVTSGAHGSQPDLSLTKTSAVMGSPMYMAPEQMRSTRAVDPRADVWALGVILYELLSGKMPFEATTMPELCALVLTEQPPPLRDRCPWVPPAVAAAIDRCLQKEPGLRFANVSEFANALVDFGPQKSRASAERISRVLRAAGVATHSLAPQSPAAAVDPRPGESTSAAWSPTTTGSGRRGNVASAIAIGGGLVVAAGVGAILLLHGRAPSVDPSAASATAALASPAASAPPSPALSAAVTSAPAVTLEPAPVPSAAPVAGSESGARPLLPAALPTAQGVHRSGPAKPSKNAPEPRIAAAPPPPLASPPPPAEPAKKRNPLDIGLK
jgi:serine/threonine protein kinase